MEKMATGWDLADLCTIDKDFHADDALACVELINYFVILFELDDWNQLLVPIDNAHMSHPTQCLSILSLTTSIPAHLSQPCISLPCLFVDFSAFSACLASKSLLIFNPPLA